MTDEQCSGLPCHHYTNQDGIPAIISCWEVTPQDLTEIQRTGKVWVSTLGHTLAPFCVMSENPFDEG